MSQVLASATVDVIKPSTPQKIGLFSVKVWGAAPYDYEKTYEIMANSDTVAAHQGINQFIAEAEALGEKGSQS